VPDSVVSKQAIGNSQPNLFNSLGKSMTSDAKRFASDDEIYFRYIAELERDESLHDGIVDTIFNFPAYVGSVNLARFLALHEMYIKTLKISGHVADIGTYKGASFLFLAKLIQLYERPAQTEVHGFDWFKGMEPGPDDAQLHDGKYVASAERLERLIQLQGLDGIAQLHNLDLTKSLPEFFSERPWLRYKFVFLDCGVREVMEQSMEYFWPRLCSGGILALDHFNHSNSPSESNIVQAHTGDLPVYSIPHSRSPSAYIIKS